MTKLRITVDGHAYDVTVESLDETPTRHRSGQAQPPSANEPPPVASTPTPPASPSAAAAGAVISPLAGRIVSINCKPGQLVEAGAELITLEAMKMNTFITAPAKGEITSVVVGVGDAVEDGQILLTLQ